MKSFKKWLSKQNDMVSPEDAWRGALEFIRKEIEADDTTNIEGIIEEELEG